MANYVVTTIADEIDAMASVASPGGSGLSLREAIILTNANPGADTITFASGMGEAFEGGGAIVLTNGQLRATGEVTIDGDVDGDGRPDVTIDAQMNSRVLETSADTTLRGLVLTNGRSPGYASGGAVRSQSTLTIEDSVVSNSATYGNGGGIFSTGAVTITGSTISGNSTASMYSGDGGGVWTNGATIMLIGSTVTGNSADGSGGGVGSETGDIALVNSTVSGNSAGRTGGGIYTYGYIALTNSTVTGNTAGQMVVKGGGIFSNSDVALYNSIVSGNFAGGNTVTDNIIIYNPDDSIINNNSIVAGDASQIFAHTFEFGNSGYYGGVAMNNGGPVPTVALKADISNPALDFGEDGDGPGSDARGLAYYDAAGVMNNGANISDAGAYELQIAESLVVTTTDDVVDLFDGETSLREAIMLANAIDGPDTITFASGMGEAFEFGGTIALDSGQLVISSDITIDGDIDDDGIPDVTVIADTGRRVFLVSGGTSTIHGMEITDGSIEDGANIRVNGGATLHLSNSSVSSGTAITGGGILIDTGATVHVTNSTVSGNSATGFGGGIANFGSATLTNSTVSGNSAGDDGGGLSNYGTVVLTNTTISGNSADAFGGGILNNGTAALTNTTISGNYAMVEGGGFYRRGGTLTLTKSIVLGNDADSSGPEYEGGYTDGGSNITMGTPGDVFAAIDMVNGSMIGGLLADNGGPVQTVALKVDPSNPALDASDGTAPATDARGVDRFDQPGIGNDGSNFADLGAFEAQEAQSLVVTTEMDVVDPTDGLTSLREAIAFANDTIAGDLDDGDADNDGFANDTITFAHGVGEAFENGGTIYLSQLMELVVTSDITIEGDLDDDGVPDVTVDANSAMGMDDAASRVFAFAAGISVIDGLTVTGGEAGMALGGGAIVGSGTNVTFRNSLVTGNHAKYGGGLDSGFGGTLTLENTTVSGNVASYHGGGIFTSGTTLTLTNSTVSDNTAALNGGGVFNNQGTAALTDSTVSGNMSGNHGGGINQNEGSLTLTNSTVSGNDAGEGGGIYVTDATAMLTNVTLSGNTATSGGGGGIYGYYADVTLKNSTVSGNSATSRGGGIYGYYGSTTLTNSILLGNDAPTAPDFHNGGTFFVNTNGISIVGVEDSADIFAAIDPMTGGGLLANNGGPVQTIALLADTLNPAIDASDNATATSEDARGAPIFDTPKVDVATSARDIGAFELQVADSLIVTTTADDVDPFDGETSLREAIMFANTVDDADGDGSSNDTITFDLVAMGSGTIVLTNGQLEVTENVTIDGDVDGDGTPDVTVDAAGNSRILNTTADTTLRGLTLTGGYTLSSGGGVRATGSAALTIEDSMVSGNSSAKGGGIYSYLGGVTLTNSTVSGNSTTGPNADGGGIFSLSNDVMLTNSTVSGNSTAGVSADGGGIYSLSGAVTLTNSTVSGNSTAGIYAEGGGIASLFGSVMLTNSTVSGNSTAGADSPGGGIYIVAGDAALTNSTVSDNSTAGADSPGGGIYGILGDLALINSTVSGNSTAGAGSLGGGIHSDDGTIMLTNSIVLGNVTNYTGLGGDEIDGTVNQIGPNIIGGVDPYTVSDVFAATAEVIDAFSMATGVFAGVLADNGGPVQTIALLADEDNPALDAGDDTLDPDTDARGLPRLDLPGIANNGANFSDLGAFEIQTEVNVTPTAPATNSIVINEDVSTGPVDIGASDANGDMLAYSLKPGFEPSLGSVSFVDGNFIYDPDLDISGADGFTILIDDGIAPPIEQVVTITILPVNDDPVAGDDAVVTAEDVAAVIDVLANDTDVDGGALEVVSHTLPANGTLVDNGDGTFTYTPDANYFGPDGFDYEISDGRGGMDTAHVSITVTPVNDPPTALASNMVVTDEDTPSAPVPIEPSDVESTSFTYSLIASSLPTSGTVAFIGDSFVYTPFPDVNGADSFSFFVDDGEFGYFRQDVTVTINPVNDDPVAGDDAAATDQDLPVDIAAADLLANDSDIDGDALTVTGVSGAVNGTVSLMGTTVTFTPDPGFFGVAGFDYAISDGNGGTDTAHVTVTVAEFVSNHPPVVAPDSQALATIEGIAVAFAVTASDADDDPVTIAPGTPANGMVVDNGDGTFTYTPDPGFSGTDMFTMLVSDGNGGMDEQAVTVTVKDIPDGIDWRLFAADGWAGTVGGTGTVIGTGAFQSVKVLDLPGTVSFDASFNGGEDFICLVGNAANWSVVRSGSTAILFDGDTCVVIPVGDAGMLVGFDDGNRTLAYDELAESMRIGDQFFADTLVPVGAPAQGFDTPLVENPDALARLFLAEGGNAWIGGDLEIFGTNGAEQLTVLFGEASLGPSFNIGNDLLFLEQPGGDFTAARSGSRALFDSATTDLSVPVGEAGMAVTFANATATLAYDPMADAILIGTQTIDTTPMPLTFA